MRYPRGLNGRVCVSEMARLLGGLGLGTFFSWHGTLDRLCSIWKGKLNIFYCCVFGNVKRDISSSYKEDKGDTACKVLSTS